MLVLHVEGEDGPELCDFLSSIAAPLPVHLAESYELVRAAVASCRSYTPMRPVVSQAGTRPPTQLINAAGRCI
jgi:hypothetical protein